MSLKRKIKVTESFSMASMTDVIFLLLIFFMVTSTLIIPNAIKVNLPSMTQNKPQEVPPLKIDLTADLKIYVEEGNNKPIQIDSIEQLSTVLANYKQQHSDAVAAIYADQSVPYKRVIGIIDQVTKQSLKLVLVTKPSN